MAITVSLSSDYIYSGSVENNPPMENHPPIDTSWLDRERFDLPLLRINGSYLCMIDGPVWYDQFRWNLSDQNVIVLGSINSIKDSILHAQNFVHLGDINIEKGKAKIFTKKLLLLGGKITASKESTITYYIKKEPLICPERTEAIRQFFIKGLEEKNAKMCLEGLAECYDAIHDPLKNHNEIYFSKWDVLRFFDIPLSHGR